MHCDSRFFECRQEKRWEPSQTLKQFMPPMLQRKHIMSTPNDDPMQIDKTRFKPLTKQDKQRQCVNNFYLYYEEPSHIAGVYLKKRVHHAMHATTFTTT
jgi:hypothetical protein